MLDIDSYPKMVQLLDDCREYLVDETEALLRYFLLVKVFVREYIDITLA